jgi:hypothetical protein
LGDLGEVLLRFKPSSRVRQTSLPRCLDSELPVALATLGTFVGTFRFRGEGGYTEAFTHRVAGSPGDSYPSLKSRMACWRPTAAERREEREAVALSASRSGILFVAARFSPVMAFGLGGYGPPSPERRWFFQVLQGDTVLADGEPLSILRLAGVVGPSSAFIFDDALTSATVTPPPPVSGAGAFQRNADGSTTWTGRLSVTLPGLGMVPLTGPGSKAELEQAERNR